MGIYMNEQIYCDSKIGPEGRVRVASSLRITMMSQLMYWRQLIIVGVIVVHVAVFVVVIVVC